jgi:hypothetical protein
MMSIVLDDFEGFILPWTELMLTFFEDGLELGPETILEMCKFKVFTSFVLARTRDFDCFFLIDDTAFGMS